MVKMAMISVAMLISGWAGADEFDGKRILSAKERAQVEVEEESAHRAIDERFKAGDPWQTPSAKQKAYRAADAKVLKKHHTDENSFGVQGIRQTPTKANEVRSNKEELEAAQMKADKAKADTAKPDEAPEAK